MAMKPSTPIRAGRGKGGVGAGLNDPMKWDAGTWQAVQQAGRKDAANQFRQNVSGGFGQNKPGGGGYGRPLTNPNQNQTVDTRNRGTWGPQGFGTYHSDRMARFDANGKPAPVTYTGGSTKFLGSFKPMDPNAPPGGVYPDRSTYYQSPEYQNRFNSPAPKPLLDGNGRPIAPGMGGGSAGSMMGGGMSAGGLMGGGIEGLINAQLNENRWNQQQTLQRIDEQNAMLGQAGQALQNDPLQQQARAAAMANFAGSGPEALNQASSRINAAANMQNLQNRFLAGEQGQVGGSGLAAMNAATEGQRIAGLGQVASEAAQRRFAEQQSAIGQANQLAMGQAQFGLQAVNDRLVPNFQPQDFTGLGSLLAQQNMATALGTGLGAIGAGIGALGQQAQVQANQFAAPNIMYSQMPQGVPGLDARGNPGLASAIGLALASGRQPVALSNSDPRLAQVLGQVNSRWGGAVNAQDSLMAQAMQAYRGFGPNEMEASQRVMNPFGGSGTFTLGHSALSPENRPMMVLPGGRAQAGGGNPAGQLRPGELTPQELEEIRNAPPLQPQQANPWGKGTPAVSPFPPAKPVQPLTAEQLQSRYGTPAQAGGYTRKVNTWLGRK